MSEGKLSIKRKKSRKVREKSYERNVEQEITKKKITGKIKEE